MKLQQKSGHTTPRFAATLAVSAALVLPGVAHAYVGPGLGLGTVMVILGFIGSLLLAVFGIFWYPIKRFFKKRRAGAPDEPAKPVEDGASPEEAEST